MKLFVTVFIISFIVCVQALTDEQRVKALELVNACAVENNVSPEEIARVRSLNFETVNENVHCLAKCFLDRAGFFENGVLNEQVAFARLTLDADDTKKEYVRSAITKCKDVTGATPCEKEYNAFRCYAASRLVQL